MNVVTNETLRLAVTIQKKRFQEARNNTEDEFGVSLPAVKVFKL